jgi:hypothetical protein
MVQQNRDLHLIPAQDENFQLGIEVVFIDVLCSFYNASIVLDPNPDFISIQNFLLDPDVVKRGYGFVSRSKTGLEPYQKSWGKKTH